jgi:hypothetical protein
MITPERLQTLISYRAPELNSLARANGYKGPAFSSCKFLGITNGGQFCYMAVFLVEGGTDSTKVFLTNRAGITTAEVDKVEEWSYN